MTFGPRFPGSGFDPLPGRYRRIKVNGVTVKRTKSDTSIHVWPVFCARMVADIDGTSEHAARERLDTLVERGVLLRHVQQGSNAPDVYYLSNTRAS